MAELKLSGTSIISDASGTPTLNAGVTLNSTFPAGHVLQTKVIRYDTPTTYTTGNAITGLRLTIIPVSADSLLWMQWTFFGEDDGHDGSCFRVYKDGLVITTAGYEGQGNNRGTSPGVWDVIATSVRGSHAWGSTPGSYGFSYYIKSGSTSSQYYEPFAWHSSGGSSTNYINRAQSLAGQSSYENAVSFGIIQEIADSATTEVVL